MAFDTWESYFYPPPDEGTLRNLFDERDPVVLTRLEYVETARRQRELLAGQVAIPKTYDADHVRAIHRHLFQDGCCCKVGAVGRPAWNNQVHGHLLRSAVPS
ncbi:hypothetical protein [Corynebacterium sanguinis]